MSALYIPTRWLITTPDLANDPDVFPLLPGQSFLTSKAPNFSTTVKKSVSGREVRLANYSAPLWSFKVQYELLRDKPTLPELMRLWGFFAERLGMFGQFNYFDPSDNTVNGQPIGTGDGTTTTFQLARLLGSNTNGILEPIYVLNGTPTVTVNGTPTTAFTVGAYGALEFTAAPAEGAVIAWSGSFMFLCRFDQDLLDAAQMVKDIWSQEGLAFVSLKP